MDLNMVLVVIIFNLLIALACLYAAWRMWRLGRFLAQVADTLTAAERRTHAVLYRAPDAIAKGQMGIYQLRRSYQQLQPQIQRLQQVMGLLSLVQRFWLGRRFSLQRPYLRR